MDPARLLHIFNNRRRGLGAELLRGGLGSGGMRVAEIGLGVGAAMLLARQLGVSGLGVYAMAIAAAGLIGLPIEFGLPALVTREAARAHVQGDHDGFAAVLSFATRLILLITALFGLAAVVLWAELRARYPVEQIETFAAALAIPPLAALANVRAAALRSLRKPLLGTAAESMIRPGAFVALLAGAALLAPEWLSPARAAALNSIAAGLGLAFAATALGCHAPRREAARQAVIRWHEWIALAFSLGLLRGLRIAQPQILLLVLGAFGSVEAAGLFRIAQRSATLGSFGFNTVAVLVAPYLARLDAAGDRERLQRLLTASARTITAFAIPPFLLFVFVGHSLLNLLFGAGFQGAYMAMVILSFAFVVTGVLGLAQIVMTMLRRERIAAAATAVSLAASTVLCAMFAGPLGATGAAAVFGASLVGVSLVLWHQARQVLDLRTSAFGH